MNPRRLTLQVTLSLTILLIGIVGLGLVISTELIYSKMVHEYQVDAGSELLAHKSEDLIQDLVGHQKELGFRLQSEHDFAAAVRNRNLEEMVFWLDQEFNRYFVTIGLLKLEKIIVYDSGMQFLTASTRGIGMNRSARPPCDALVESIANMPVTRRLKPHSEICLFDGRPLISTIVSIGTLKPTGYMQIISDPAHMLAKLEFELDRQIRITAREGRILHQSEDWPLFANARDTLISSQDITASDGTVALTIHSASSMQAFSNKLATTRYRVTAIALILIGISLAFAIYILRSGLRPLRNLESAAASVSEGTFVTVDESGFPEIATPIRSFNHMLRQFRGLIQKLQSEVVEHEQTERKLMAARDQAELHAATAENRKYFSELTLQSIVDGVITTDISGHITSMNPMAERLTGWRAEEAVGKALIQIMFVVSEDTRHRIYDPIEDIERKSVLDEPVSATLIQRDSNVETPIEYVAAPMRDKNDDIAGIVLIIHDESVQRSLNRQLTFQATHDALTGLINRYEFERRLENILYTASSDASPNTLCYIDLDQFKLVNDTCGHAAGDELLREVTVLLKERVGDNSTLARLGGDEFGLLLTGCDTEQARQTAGSLLEVIRSYSFNWDDYSFTIGISIGIVAIDNSITSCEELLRNADSACYLAKENGRNQIQVVTHEDDKLITQQREMHWVSRINHALEENRFELHFQTIAPLKEYPQGIDGHGEVLLRMVDKAGERVSPGLFLPAAERYNMIVMIDEWAVEHAIQWLAQRNRNILVSINLSGKSVSTKDFLHAVVSFINEYGVDPRLLCFEITETAAISNLNTAVHFMTALKKLGCSFALDDFGSGLSSFSYLTSLPVDYLKIDGTFVVDIDKDPMHRAMVKSINEVGQVMGIRTIAEFAVSESIVEHLRMIGVDYAQGYHIDKPRKLTADMPLYETREIIAKGTTNIHRFPGTK